MSTFREALRAGRPLIGLWQALANPYTVEICARAGYDWLLIDGEHAPNTMQTLLAQLQATAAFAAVPIGRVPSGEPVALKQYLDIGFGTLLIPMIDSAEQARQVVAATRFPPLGNRGVASATSRASGYGADRSYLAKAHEQVTLIAQIESAAAVEAVDAIAAVNGIDALFVGPGDLAASLGHLGNPSHVQVQEAIERVRVAVAQVGKPCGIFAVSVEDARRHIAEGFAFVSVGTDIGVLAQGARGLVLECTTP